MIELIEQSRMACDQLIDVTGRAVLQAVLQLSAAQWREVRSSRVNAAQRAWFSMAGKRPGDAQRPQNPGGTATVAHQGASGKEVEIPAYTAMQNPSPLGERMLDTLLCGVSTRNYKDVIPQMAETVGVSKSAVSRAAIEASEASGSAALAPLRSLEDTHHLHRWRGLRRAHHDRAVGVDSEGHKHVLGIREGATENSTIVTELLQDIAARGVDARQKRLFIIDGSKAIRAAINAVFGADQPVQRCRAHKLRNVLDHLPEEQKEQVKSLLRAAWKMEAKAGHEPHPQAGRVAGARTSIGRGQPAGGAGGVLHHQPSGPAAVSDALPGDDQYHRKSSCWSAHTNPPA